MEFTTEIFAISGILNGVFAMFYGFSVYINNRKDKISTPFFLMTIALVLWSFSYWYWLMSSDYDSARFWIRLLCLGSFFIPVFHYQWVIRLLNIDSLKTNIILYSSYTLAIISSFFLNTELVVKDIISQSIFLYWPLAGPLYSVVIVFLYIFLTSYSAYLIYTSWLHTIARNDKAKLMFVLLGSTIGFGGGLTNFPLWYEIDLLPFGTFLVALFPFVLGYASMRHNLFNFRAIATKLLISLILSLLLLQYVFSELSYSFQFRSILFLLVGGSSYLLIKSVNKEIENREKGERIARYLANANARLRELDRQKTEFVSIASHQLRSPIAAIKGYASLITDGSYGEMPQNLKEPLHRIAESGQRISIMVDDFLNVTRIEQGRMVYDMQPHYVCGLLKSVAEEQAVVIEEKGLTLNIECENPDTIAVKADEGKLKQIFSNLLDNAIKYTQEGSITISVFRVEPEHKVLVKFKDTGIGIAREEISNLFQKFNRASNANEANVLGTGLGLYIAREIMKAHEGWIDVDSEGLGKGSTFTVELPACDEEPKPKKEQN